MKQLSIVYKASFFVLFVFLSLIAINVWETWNARSAQLAESRTATLNLARALAQHVESTVKLADMVLVELVERLEHDVINSQNMDRIHKVLVLSAAELPLLQRISVIDVRGRLVATSQETISTGIDNSDNEYFIFHRNHADQGPHIGPPIRALSSGMWIITVSRRVQHTDGSFAGVALASIDTAYFNKFYASVDVGHSGAITLVSSSVFLVIA